MILNWTAAEPTTTAVRAALTAVLITPNIKFSTTFRSGIDCAVLDPPVLQWLLVRKMALHAQHGEENSPTVGSADMLLRSLQLIRTVWISWKRLGLLKVLAGSCRCLEDVD